jgi:hypothetical protein
MTTSTTTVGHRPDPRHQPVWSDGNPNKPVESVVRSFASMFGKDLPLVVSGRFRLRLTGPRYRAVVEAGVWRIYEEG